MITTSGRLPRHGTIRVRNNGDVIHPLQMTKVADGVTDEQVQAEYDQLLTGQQPTFESAALRGARRTYLLQCFVPDDMTGLPHAFMGMHKVVVID